MAETLFDQRRDVGPDPGRNAVLLGVKPAQLQRARSPAGPLGQPARSPTRTIGQASRAFGIVARHRIAQRLPLHPVQAVPPQPAICHPARGQSYRPATPPADRRPAAPKPATLLHQAQSFVGTFAISPL